MAYFVIENFKQGLDTRRFELSAPPGSLIELENAHITQAGDIEKRKAFTLFATLPDGTFGLEATSSGLVTFGSVTPPVMPTGVTYVRCQHPDSYTAMSAILCSGTFGGKAWCAARFTSGAVYAFYDGSLIPAFVNGAVQPGATTDEDVAAGIYNSLIEVLAGKGFYITLIDNTVDIKAPLNEVFEIMSIDFTSSTGSISSSNVSSGDPPTSYVAPYTDLQVTGAGDGQIVSILCPVRDANSDIYFESLLLSPLDIVGAAGASEVAKLLCDTINARPGPKQYTAFWATGSDKVRLSPPASVGDTINGLYAQITFTGGLSFNGPASSFTAVLPIEVKRLIPVYPYTTYVDIIAKPSGGTSPFTYAWTKVEDVISTGQSIVSGATTHAVRIRILSPPFGEGYVSRARFRVTITDDDDADAVADVYVSVAWRGASIPPL